MVIEIFSLCDAATCSGGKLNVLGAFDAITTPKVPVVHPQCAVALRARFYASEGSPHAVSLTFMDADGRHMIPPVQGKFDASFSDGQRSCSANLILNLQSLKFERAGEYAIDLAIDGHHRASLPLFIREKTP